MSTDDSEPNNHNETEAAPMAHTNEDQRERPQGSAETGVQAIAQQQALAMAEAREATRSLTVRQTFDLAEMSLPAIWGLARQLAWSSLVPRDLQNKPANVFAVLLKGAELGLSAMTSVAEVMVVEGKLTLSSHLQGALVQRSGKAKIFRIVQSTAEEAVVEVQRHDWTESTKISFTIAEAKALGLTERGRDAYAKARNPWNAQPANMLRRRAIARAAREFFGDVVIAYDPDEVDREEVPSAPPVIWVPPAAAAPSSPPPPSEPRVEPDLPEPEGVPGPDGNAMEIAERHVRSFLDFAPTAKNRDELRAAWQRYIGPYDKEKKNDELSAEVHKRTYPEYSKRWKELGK